MVMKRGLEGGLEGGLKVKGLRELKRGLRGVVRVRFKKKW